MTDHIGTDNRERRFVVDQHESMGYPLVPIGRTIAEQVTETETHRTVRFDAIGWQIEQPKGDEAKVPSTILYDGYYGLMWLWKEAGFPDDGEVHFSRYNFLQNLGWVSNGKNTSGGRLSKPSGRHYRQLRDVCHTLVRTVYFRETQGRSQGFNVLSSYDLQDDMPGPRDLGEELPKRSRVVFNPEFVKRMKDGSPLVKMDLDLYLSLSTGAPRVLFRILSWMRHHGIDNMPLEPLFHRMGSVQKSYLPSVARKLLDTATNELIARSVLRAAPRYERIDSIWHVVFPFGDPEKARYEDEVLVREAASCGVNPTVAKDLLVAHRSRFERLMALVATGNLRNRTNLPGTIVTFTRQVNIPLPEPDGTPAPRIATTDMDAYRSWVTKKQDELAQAKGIDLDAISRDVLSTLKARGVAQPEGWFVEGLVRMRLSHMLDLPGFQWYEQRLRDGTLEQAVIGAGV